MRQRGTAKRLRLSWSRLSILVVGVLLAACGPATTGEPASTAATAPAPAVTQPSAPRPSADRVPTSAAPATEAGRAEGASRSSTPPLPAGATPGPAEQVNCHQLQWLGHAAFLLTTAKGTRILFDPFGPDLGYPVPTLQDIDAVLISNSRADSANTEMAPGARVVDGQGLSVVHGVIGESHLFSGFPGAEFFGGPTYRDTSAGAQFGPNALILIATDALTGTRFLHLGGLGHVLSQEQVAKIGRQPRVDVLMVPVGGYAGLDAAGAAEVVRQINPRIAIPMAYRTNKTRADWPGAGVEPFLAQGWQNVRRETTATLAICLGELPDETVVVVLAL